MPPLRRPFRVLLALLVLVSSSGLTLARFTDAAGASGSIRSDTLVAPTGLGAAGGAQITLSWTATVDTYATGYNVYRSTSAGGTYSLIGTVTPRTAVTTTDSPGAGTFFYKVQAYFQSWESADSATVSAASGTTAYAACVSTAADTTGAGDNNGYESNPARACVDDSSFATDSNSGTGTATACGSGATPDATKDRHRFWGFVTGLPGTVTSIIGIRVRVDLALNNATGTTNLCAQLSWDAGTTWTTLKTVSIPSSSEGPYIFGSTTDTWGRTWTPAQLNTTNFRVRLIDASASTSKQFQLDYVAVSVTYSP
jgi:hypothetical protein